MSFKETDYAELLQFLKRLLNEERDPLLFRERVAEMVKIYDELPIYPGIVNMCASMAAKQIQPQEAEIGQKIFIKSDEDFYCGTVSKKTDEGVVIREAKSSVDETEIDFSWCEMNEVTTINHNVVNDLWPSLVFQKERK